MTLLDDLYSNIDKPTKRKVELEMDIGIKVHELVKDKKQEFLKEVKERELDVDPFELFAGQVDLDLGLIAELEDIIGQKLIETK